MRICKSIYLNKVMTKWLNCISHFSNQITTSQFEGYFFFFFNHMSFETLSSQNLKNNEIIHCCSVAQLCPTLWDPWTAPCQACLSFTISRSLLKAHVLQVGDAVQPSHPPSSPSAVFYLSEHWGLCQGVSSLHHMAKVLEIQLQH